MILEKYSFFTIIIPTYNRADCVKKNLGCLLPQVRKYFGSVRVYVSDNASTDKTREVVRFFLKDYSDVLTYYVQPKNIGSNPNFFHAANNVNSKYICLLGDDDYVTPNYLDVVIPILENNRELGLLNVNMLSVTDNNKIVGTRDDIAYDNHIGYYKTGAEFIKKHMIAPSLMSSNIFIRKGYLEVANRINGKEYPGYDWYLALIMSVIDKQCAYYDIPIIFATAPSNNRWSDDAPWYHIYGFGHMFDYLEHYVKGVKKEWEKVFFSEKKRTWYHLYIISQNKNLYRKRYKKIRRYAQCREYANLIYLYIYLPLKIAYYITKILSKVNKKYNKFLE